MAYFISFNFIFSFFEFSVRHLQGSFRSLNSFLDSIWITFCFISLWVKMFTKHMYIIFCKYITPAYSNMLQIHNTRIQYAANIWWANKTAREILDQINLITKSVAYTWHISAQNSWLFLSIFFTINFAFFNQKISAIELRKSLSFEKPAMKDS